MAQWNSSDERQSGSFCLALETMQPQRARDGSHHIHRRSAALRSSASNEPCHARMGRRHHGRDALARVSLGLPPDESGHAIMTAKIVIIGGGLAGLSAGHHLAEYDPVVFEKETAVGGLCRSFSQDGFTFDCTG